MPVSGVRKAFGAFTAIAVGALLVLCGVPAPASATFASECSTPTRLLDPASSSVTVASGETVLLASGTFTGGVNALPAGGTLCVAAGAILQPAYINNASGSIVIASGGSASFPSISVGTGFALDVEGSAVFAGLNVNGASTFRIATGASMEIAGGFSPSAGSYDNEGTLTVRGTFNVNTGADVRNANQLVVGGNANLNGRVENTGTVTVSGALDVNGGAMFANFCHVQTTGPIFNNATGSTNSGIISAGGAFTNNGTWRQSLDGLLAATALADDGMVGGFGAYQFTGPTSVQGTFVGDSAGNPIQVQTQAPPGRIFDVQTGTVANVVRVTALRATALDTPLPGCSNNTVPYADLSVSKSGPATVLSGGNVTYTLVVANAGPDDASGVVLTDALPPEATGVVDAGGGTASGGTITWAVGDLASGASASRTFIIAQSAPVGTVLQDRASAVSDTSDPDPSNNDGTSADSQAATTVVGVTPPANDPPVAQPLVRPGITGQLVFGRVLATDADTGQKLTYQITTPPAHGEAVMTAGGGFAYLSAIDFTGDDSFTYTVCDDGEPALCDSAVVSLPISPLAADDAASTVTGTPVTIPITANDSLGAALDSAPVTAPSNGSVTLDAASGTAEYTPAAGFTGQDTFQYRICSPTDPALCSTATVTVTVRPPNNPPVVEALHLVTTTDLPVTDTIRATDPDVGQTLTFARGIPPRSGTATTSGDQTTYTPRSGLAGRDNYSVIVCDDGAPVLCAVGAVTVDVYPIANPDTASTPAGTAVQIAVTANDRGLIGPPTVASNPAGGAVRVSGSTIVYTPNAGFAGTDTFTYTICAAGAPDLCDTATVTVTVVAPVVPPDGSGDGSASTGDGRSSGDLAATGSSIPIGAGAALAAALGAIGLGVLALRRRPRRG